MPARTCGTGTPPIPAHMPESHRRHAEWTPARITAWAGKTGPATAALVAGDPGIPAASRAGLPRRAGHHPPGQRHGADRAEAACARALHLRSYSYRSVESILRTGLDRQPLPGEHPALPPHPGHRNVRGASYYRYERTTDHARPAPPSRG